MIWFRRLHKWIGLAIGVQVCLWMISGLMMALLDHEKVQGLAKRTDVEAPRLTRSDRAFLEPSAIVDRLPASATVSAIELMPLLDRTLYRVRLVDAVKLFDARSGDVVTVDEKLARRIARRDYAGTSSVAEVTRISAPTMEVRKHEGPVWRIDFADESATSIYVSASDGRILERRNDTWRLFDVFWMLHIMDYDEREDFNNVLVVTVGLIAAFFSVTGIVLLIDSFDREDFRRLLPGRAGANVTVLGPSGEVVARVAARAGQRLYDALSAGGIVLPSNCGGGGSCGLCEVALATDAPVTEADARLVPAARRAAGARLSCQARVLDGLAVTVPREALDAKVHGATVSRVRCVTPFIREITLDLEDASFEYAAGSYVHVIIPPHRIALADLDVPDEVRRAWGNDVIKLESRSEQELRRAYSLAAPCADHPGRVLLNVRLMLPGGGIATAPAGAGSSHMWSLRNGDRVEFVGPLGEFHATRTERDMIVIGGGAGMSPLRAIIRDELLYRRSGRRIQFWYGARSLADLYYVDEFDALEEAHDNFLWRPVLSAPAPSDRWTGPVGNVHEVIRDESLSGMARVTECEFFVCGPPAMLAATRAMLRALGVPDERISFDDFGI